MGKLLKNSRLLDKTPPISLSLMPSPCSQRPEMVLPLRRSLTLSPSLETKSPGLEWPMPPLSQVTCKVGNLPLLIIEPSMVLNRLDWTLTPGGLPSPLRHLVNSVLPELEPLRSRLMPRPPLTPIDHFLLMGKGTSLLERPLELNSCSSLLKLNKFLCRIQITSPTSSRLLDQN